MFSPRPSRTYRRVKTPKRESVLLPVKIGKRAAGTTKRPRRPNGGSRSQIFEAIPVRPWARSRRPSTCATHSSTPTRGRSRASGRSGRLVATSPLDLLDVRATEQAARPDEHDDDEKREDVEVLEGRALRQVAGGVGLRQADDEAAEHCARDAPDAADHGCGEPLEAGQEAHEVVDLAEDEPEHDAGRTRERRADEEGRRDD